MRHTFGELFAGVGGFGMGMEAAGWSCAWQVEWDKQCQQVLRHHWPDVAKYGDVSTASGFDLAPVDCITFGSPCQDLSVAGKRAGLDGNRSGLFYEAVRIIKEMRSATESVWPRWAIWENVVGALSSNHGHDFAAVLDSLAEAGAVAIEWAVLDAQHFGVPQRRRRVFVIACFDPATADRCGDPLLPISESLPRDSAPQRTKGQGVTSALTKGLGTGGPDSAHALAGWLVPEVVNDPTDGVVADTVAWGIRSDAVRDGIALAPSADAEGRVRLRNPGLGITEGLSPTLDASQPHIVAYALVNDPTDDVVGTSTWWNGNDIAPCLDSSMLANQQRMPDKNRFAAVLVPVSDPYPDLPDTAPTICGADFTKHQCLNNQAVDAGLLITVNVATSDTSPTVTSKWAKGSGGPAGDECQNLVAVWTKAKRAQSVNDDETGVEGEVAPTLNAFDQGDTRATVLAFGHTQGIDIQASETNSPTLPRNGGGAGVVVPSLTASNDPSRSPQSSEVTQQVAAVYQAAAAVRRLTPVECERLMGWPDNHTAVGVAENGDTVQLADSPRYRMIGNGVASPVAAWIGKHLLAVDGEQ